MGEIKMQNAVRSCVGVALVLSMTSSVLATMSRDEEERLRESATVIREIRNAPDKGIPEDIWSKARCVVVIPSMKKAAFVVGGEYGAGAMSCRRGDGWTAPVFMQLAKGSWGLQIGAESVDVVLVVNDGKGADKLLEDKISLGADASVTAGPIGRTASAATDVQLKAEMLSYSRSQGLFAGIDLSGGILRPDKEANARTYGTGLTPRQIVREGAHVDVPKAAHAFLSALAGDDQHTE